MHIPIKFCSCDDDFDTVAVGSNDALKFLGVCGTALQKEADCSDDIFCTCIYIAITVNADDGACDILCKDIIDCTENFDAGLVCGDDDVIVDLDTASDNTVVGDDTLIGMSPPIQTRWNDNVEEYEDVFSKPG